MAFPWMKSRRSITYAYTWMLAEQEAAAREYLEFARKGPAVIGIMTADEIEDTLRRRRIGRIGCSVGDRPYVVPINYAYDRGWVYAFSAPGRKIDVMRVQPRVCFEVDQIDGPATWRCVVADGVFEEITDEAARRTALVRLIPANGGPVPRVPNAGSRIVVFRLRLEDKTGRFERYDV